MTIRIKLSFFTLAFVCLTTFLANGQYNSYDFTITTKGLSEEYLSKFKDNSKKEILVRMFNDLKIPYELAPIKVSVSFDDNEGNVIVEVNYDQDKIFAKNTNYKYQNETWKSYMNGKGISVFLQSMVFEALSVYKKAVATNGYSMDRELLAFESSVKLKKANGDWIMFYAVNSINSQGFYPFTFYNNVHMNIGGKSYETETSNSKVLSEMNVFLVGKIVGLNGSITDAYYFCKFFKIETE